MPWTKMVSMELDDEDVLDMACPIPISNKSSFPYGLRICLTHTELKKLNLDSDCDLGDLIDIRAMARVTNVSKNKTDRGEECRIELQIEDLALEDENKE